MRENPAVNYYVADYHTIAGNFDYPKKPIDKNLLKHLIKSELVSHRDTRLTSQTIDLIAKELFESINDNFIKLHLE